MILSAAKNTPVDQGTRSLPERGVEEFVLQNRHLRLTVFPGFGCHWARLEASVRGEWIDLLVPVENCAELVDEVARARAYFAGDAKAGAGRRSFRGSFFLAPWSNRLANASFEFDGEEHSLRVSSGDGTAIHGDVRARPWQVDGDVGHFVAHLDSADHASFNFPYHLAFTQTVELNGDRLTTTAEIVNRDVRRAPVGLGFHPYFRRRLTERDRDLFLRIPASTYYPLENSLPSSPPQPVDCARDLRQLQPLGDRALDDCVSGFEDRVMRLIWPGTGLEARIEVDETLGHAILFAPDDAEGQPSDFIAIEPVTNVNDGFNLLARGQEGTGVRILEPGESLRSEWSLSVGDV